ncbi:MAG: AmmeMemoRadiSam system protein B [Desulfobacteraceae bacterium]|nr:AmmeMemoRadiSam system protein B [Desulfobacteraceae bacterium]
MIRIPAVANQFYPGNAALLRETVAGLMPAAGPPKKKALAVVVPHAGYIYSGGVAAQTFARVDVPRDVIILGPNHHGRGAQAAIMREGSWEMPLGRVPVNGELADAILRHRPGLITVDESAHRLEHSLEVQIPFLQYMQPELTLVPLVLGTLALARCREAGTAIAAAVREYARPVLVVASTDMTHYESRETASRKDRLALDLIRGLDPDGLYQTVAANRISMCGIIPTTIALAAAIELGARHAELVRYTDSGEASGDTAQVVGYAGFVIE